MLRMFLLWLSRNKTMRRWVMKSRLTRRLVQRFVAGASLDEAARTGQRLNEAGLLITMDHLGESVDSEREADEAMLVYHRIIERMKGDALQGTVSLKPTQLGLALDADRARERIESVVRKATAADLSVEIDMEDSPYTEATLQIYEALLPVNPELRVCLQAYLKRTDDDLRRLIDMGGSVRLVKGAYREPPEVAVQRKAEVNEGFVRQMELALTPDAVRSGFYLALGTHDDKLVSAAREIALKNGVEKDQFEFQFLYGIRQDLQRSLVSEGYRVRIYQPYGQQWYPYFMRRLAERPANLWFLVKNLFRA